LPAAWRSAGELVCAQRAAGLSLKEAQALIGQSPLLRRVRPGVHALRGSRHR